MAHIHTAPGQYDMTVSAYILNITASEARILLHKHKKLGIWLQPGGHIELDENPWDAIQREIMEETGYHMTQLTLLQPKHVITDYPGGHPMPLSIGTHAYATDDHYHTDLAYGFTTHQEPAATVDAGESTHFWWATLQELHDLPGRDLPRHTRALAQALLSAPEKWVNR